MQEQTPEELTDAMIKMMIKVYNAKIKDKLTLSDLARKSNIHPSHPTYQKTTKFLISEGVLEFSHTIGAYNFFKLNNNKLQKIIDNSSLWKEYFFPFLKIKSNYIYLTG